MFLSEAVAIFGYGLLITAVYKIFQLGKEVREIKDLLKKSGRNASHGATAIPPVSSAESDAAADEYAANLMRSLQAESAHSKNEAQKTP